MTPRGCLLCQIALECWRFAITRLTQSQPSLRGCSARKISAYAEPLKMYAIEKQRTSVATTISSIFTVLRRIRTIFIKFILTHTEININLIQFIHLSPFRTIQDCVKITQYRYSSQCRQIALQLYVMSV